MKYLSIIFACLLACTLGFAQDAPVERNLPPMTPSECSAPAQIQGQAAVDAVIERINEAGHIFRGVQGGCGRITLTDEQKGQFADLMLADVRLDIPDATCEALNSQNVDEPFGLTSEVRCSKLLPVEGGIMTVSLVVGVKVDKDGEVIVYFVTATDK